MTSPLSKMRKERENFVARNIYRPISVPLTLFLSKIRATPNQVSFMSVLSSIAAGVFFSLGEWQYLVIGWFFLQLTYLLDYTDGSLARYTGKSSKFGMWVDEFSNKLHKFFYVLGAAIGVFRLTNNPFYLVLGFIASFNWFFSAYISETKTRFDSERSEKRKTSFGKFLNQIPMSLIVINTFGFLVLINNAVLALWFVAIVNLIWIKHIYGTRKLWRREHNS